MCPMNNTENLGNPSVVIVGPKTSEIRDLPYPKISDQNDAIVAVHYVGVCGSDVMPRLILIQSYPNKTS